MTPIFALSVALAADGWQRPPEAALAVLDAPEIPSASLSPTGEHLLLTTPVRYPPLTELAAPMHRVAGVRVQADTGALRTWPTFVDPVLKRISTGAEAPVALPRDVAAHFAAWSADGERVVIGGSAKDHVGLWIVGLDGSAREVPGLALVPTLEDSVSFLPDQRHLLVKTAPAGRGAPPAEPLVPAGPIVRDSDGEGAVSTYEARDLLGSALDEARFDHWATSQLAIVDLDDLEVHPIGQPGVFSAVSASPDGRFLLVERLQRPWSTRVAWWRFAHDVEVWTIDGQPLKMVASLPTADEVPVRGVPVGPRSVHWRQDVGASLVWLEALDGGDPQAKATHRDLVMQLRAPFGGSPKTVMRAAHRVVEVRYGDRGLMLVEQSEWERRWRHVWTVNPDRGEASAAPWFDLSENERYADPGRPLLRREADGRVLIDRDGADVYFTGVGGSPEGDRPFLDLRPLKPGAPSERVFQSPAGRYEQFLGWTDAKRKGLVIRSETEDEPPNVLVVARGEQESVAVTRFSDPAPQVRGISKQIVTYERADGVPQSFTLYLPPGYTPGTPLPTVVWAYPLEYSDPKTAGQVKGSPHTFDRLGGPSPLFFALAGYAVLADTTMPVLGDPLTAYDTFVPQLVSSAQAAIEKAVALGVTDPDRVGVGGHSHGGLMTVTLLAHSDLFRAGIARSGAYNHTLRPFGFQNERRQLWDARETYLDLSPVMFARQIDEPLLLVHGAIDENPGTVPLQSERLFEAVRGVGGTTRLVMLPFEGHGYKARESVEHVLAEQLAWFERYVAKPEPRASAER